ncbi:MAG TPA: hypothetical protein VMG34_12205 [Bacteroidota bacterium]|nr:hypothetical protein [Bacteroidota bacterium]
MIERTHSPQPAQMTKTVLFVSHKKAQCGVYEFGKSITDVLESSTLYRFKRVECSSVKELEEAVGEANPAAIIYNYYEAVMPWVMTRYGLRLCHNHIAGLRIPQIGIIHEITQHVANTATGYRKRLIVGGPNPGNQLFDFYIAPDPTLLLLNPLVYKTGRLIPSYRNDAPVPPIPVIGSFGFGTPKKGFERIVELVQDEFDEARIRFNIPSADFGDKEGVQGRAIAERCQKLVRKPGVKLVVTHDFLDQRGILDFLAGNTINVFLYEDKGGRGLSSALDLAMAVKRPIAVSDAVMFRHLFDADPSVCVTNNSLRSIIRNGFTPLQKHYEEWTAENLRWEYERIVTSCLERWAAPPAQATGLSVRLRAQYRRLMSKPDYTSPWLGEGESVAEDDLRSDKSTHYDPVAIPSGASLNRILDDPARTLYAPAVQKLTELVPITMARKIPRANVQQAFVFDTICRLAPGFPQPKLLCVGSYQDTASMGLRKMGYAVDEIDPMINYSLQEFCTRPGTLMGSYDIVFSTSVIEHDPDDESFARCVSDLLAPGGIAVMTCDFKEGWKKGDPKPDPDVRLYTERDLRDRLLPIMKDCSPVDQPHWECENPDFVYLGIYRYTFATLVVRKNRSAIGSGSLTTTTGRK